MKKIMIFCPHCGYGFDDDDMLRANDDLFAIAPNEEDADVDCPDCKKSFYVRGSYRAEYETFKCEDDAD